MVKGVMTHNQTDHSNQPIIFHLGRDPGEKYPISTRSSEYKSVWTELKVLVNKHQNELKPARPQLNYCDDAVMVGCYFSVIL